MEHVLFGLIHARGKAREAVFEAVGDLTPLLFHGIIETGLREGRADRCGGHHPLAFGDMGESISHEVYATTLPRGLQHLGRSRLQSLVAVGDHQLDSHLDCRAAVGRTPREREPARTSSGRYRGLAGHETALFPVLPGQFCLVYASLPTFAALLSGSIASGTPGNRLRRPGGPGGSGLMNAVDFAHLEVVAIVRWRNRDAQDRPVRQCDRTITSRMLKQNSSNTPA